MNKEKLTRNQALVLEQLTQAAKPLSAYAILDELRGEGLKAPLQVYRALEKLVETGQVHRLESLNAFIACAHQTCTKHQGVHSGIVGFAVCEGCGAAQEFMSPAIETQIEDWCSAKSFAREKTTFEIRGLCKACQG